LSTQLAVADEVVLDCTVEMMTALEKSKPRPRVASESTHESQLAEMRETAGLAAAEAVAEQIAAMRELIEENTVRVSAALEETRRELQALREVLNAQLAKRARGQSIKRRSKVPISGAE
jgi:selenocysteine lyase/cysteine desulfurase